MLITNFQDMYWEVKNASTDHDDELIFSFTADEFNEYQNSLRMKCLQAGTSAPTAALQNPMIHAPDPLTEFRKGIKQDASIFPTLKDINQWDSWKRIFVTTAETQGVQNVLDTRYTLTLGEIPLF